MLNNFKINFESTLTIFLSQLFVVLIGLAVTVLLSQQVYRSYFEISKNIDTVLDLKSRVVAESIDYEKIKSAEARLNEDVMQLQRSSYKNPFAYEKK